MNAPHECPGREWLKRLNLRIQTLADLLAMVSKPTVERWLTRGPHQVCPAAPAWP